MNNTTNALYEGLKNLGVLSPYIEALVDRIVDEGYNYNINLSNTDRFITDKYEFAKLIKKSISRNTINRGPAYTLECSFIFNKTKQGKAFWKDVSDKISSF